MAKKVKVIHHTAHTPYHTQIRGTEIYILNHALKSGHSVDVISRRSDIPEEKREFIKGMYHSAVGGELHFIPYDRDIKIAEHEEAVEGRDDKELVQLGRRRPTTKVMSKPPRKLTGTTAELPVTSEQYQQRAKIPSLQRVKALRNNLRAMQTKRADLAVDEEKYLNLIGREIEKHDRVVLAYHEMDTEDIKAIKAVKDRFGDKVEVAAHFHCLSAYYTISDPKKDDERGLFQEIIDKGYLDKIVAVSDEVKTEFEREYPGLKGKMEVVEGGVDDELYSPRAKEGKEERKDQIFNKGHVDYVVSYVGRFADPKGKEILVSMLRQFELSNPNNVGFMFAVPPGDRPTKQFMEEVGKYAPRLMKEGKIQFCYDISKFTKGLDEKKKRELSDHFTQEIKDPRVKVITTTAQSASDIYIHPSSSESLGLSVIEAIKTGLPIVVSDIKGIRQYTSDEHGRFVRLGQDYIDWTMLYQPQKGEPPRTEIGKGKTVSSTTKLGREFRNEINGLVERMKSGEIYRGYKRGEKGSSIGRFATKARELLYGKKKVELTDMVERLDNIYRR
ncbi:TPA: glycosyltransferase family 4 protein [Candidatus Woesearchaeota archaeon]|nr:glycosyltransferase family 4 protein [Candidatus Woesearchaeota archaeon]